MSHRLWTPLHDWLGKLGLCKPFCLSKIQCSKLKSPVSLRSGMSQLGREAAEWRFSHLPPGVFLQVSWPAFLPLFSVSLFKSSHQALFNFLPPSLLPQPDLHLPPLLVEICYNCCVQSSSLRHESSIYCIFGNLLGWQVEQTAVIKLSRKGNKLGY